MTVPLSAGSPRLALARAFGEELDRAMRTRGIGAKTLGPQTGQAVSAIGNWRAGLNLPRYDSALRLAEALSWPKLAEIAKRARQGTCPRCGRTFVNEGGGAKRFCSQACRDVDEQLRRPSHGSELARAVGEATDARLAGAPERETLPAILDALRTWRASDARRVQRVDQQSRALASHQASVEAMCRGCEPEGRCRTAECALRPVSPLPLVRVDEPLVDGPARPAEGAWGPSHRAHQLEAIREANAERWSRPGERERAGELSRTRHASLTPEERAERAQRISDGIDPTRRSAASTRVHAARRERREEATA